MGNHSGGLLTPDTSAVYEAWYRTRGMHDPLLGLAFDAAFGIPKARDLMYNNVYGWFVGEGKGVYKLSECGAEELSQWSVKK